MPQLDSNTFIYQYIGIITLFILLYTILSYLVLPHLLRLILIRNLFLLRQESLSSILPFNNIAYQQLLLIKRPVYLTRLINVLMWGAMSLLRNLVSLIRSKIAEVGQWEGRDVNKNITYMLEFNLSYLILFLITEEENTNNE